MSNAEHRFPPKPSELASAVIGAVLRHVELDLEPVKAELLVRLEEPSEEFILERADRLAEDAVDTLRGQELLAQCAQALAGARAHFLEAAGRCEEAADELRTNGRRAWIAGAVRHDLASRVVWDTLDERHGVERHELGEC